MATYAHVDGAGRVVEAPFVVPEGLTIAECFNPAMNWVPCPPDVAQGWTYDGTTFAAPLPPASPTLAQQAAAMLTAGLQIVSTGTPALNGTYACDPATYQRISGIIAAIGAGLGLPGGGSTFAWLDTSGTPHAFDETHFKAFATAVMNFEYLLNTIIGSNTGTLPTLPVTIA